MSLQCGMLITHLFSIHCIFLFVINHFQLYVIVKFIVIDKYNDFELCFLNFSIEILEEEDGQAFMNEFMLRELKRKSILLLTNNVVI